MCWLSLSPSLDTGGITDQVRAVLKQNRGTWDITATRDAPGMEGQGGARGRPRMEAAGHARLSADRFSFSPREMTEVLRSSAGHRSE
jgi:hypothetical protein